MKENDIIFDQRTAGDLQRTSVHFARKTRVLCLTIAPIARIETSAVNQMYRSATSVGANIREAQYAESAKDFVHKLKVAEKEMAEFFYWLGLLSSDPPLIDDSLLVEVPVLATSVMKLLGRIIPEMKRKHGL